MHLFVVGGAGLGVFRHAFPQQQTDGSFIADVPLPGDGLYMTFVEFVPAGASAQMAQQAFMIGSPLGARPDEPTDEPHVSNGIRAAIDSSHVTSGRESPLAFDLTDDVSGVPLVDLESYLGASAQLFVVSADLTEGQCLQPQDASRGPHLVFSPLFPRTGRYKVWLQVQRTGLLAAIPFVIDVR
jgi:hypothetical protein